MPSLIKGSEVIEDAWQLVTDRETPITDLPKGDIIVPLSMWKSNADALRKRKGSIAIWLDAGEEAEDIADDIQHFGLIAINFPSFADGRGLSSAVLLRTRFGFEGELRAIGDIRRDWLSYMRRCGFDSYQMSSDEDARRAIDSLVVMSDYYQGSVVEPAPLYRRKQRN
jgi:uncharacterized protein (DUF934 family)